MCYVRGVSLDKTLTIRVDEDMWVKLRHLARERDRKPTEMVRLIVAHALRAEEGRITSNEAPNPVPQAGPLCDCTYTSEGVRSHPKSTFGTCVHGKKVFR